MNLPGAASSLPLPVPCLCLCFHVLPHCRHPAHLFAFCFLPASTVSLLWGFPRANRYCRRCAVAGGSGASLAKLTGGSHHHTVAHQGCWLFALCLAALFGVEVQALGHGGLKAAFLEACRELPLVHLQRFRKVLVLGSGLVLKHGDVCSQEREGGAVNQGQTVAYG